MREGMGRKVRKGRWEGVEDGDDSGEREEGEIGEEKEETVIGQVGRCRGWKGVQWRWRVVAGADITDCTRVSST